MVLVPGPAPATEEGRSTGCRQGPQKDAEISAGPQWYGKPQHLDHRDTRAGGLQVASHVDHTP